mgnify:CR=1 FL=1
MEYPYPKNEPDTKVSFFRNRTGPNCFSVLYKSSARFCMTPKEVKQVFGSAKFTPFVKELVDWCTEMMDKYNNNSPVEVDMEKGFGPECHLDESDPNFQTKMVT